MNDIYDNDSTDEYDERESVWYHEDDYDSSDDYFTIDQCFDYEGNFCPDRLEDAIFDGEYVPKDW